VRKEIIRAINNMEDTFIITSLSLKLIKTLAKVNSYEILLGIVLSLSPVPR